MTQFQLKDSTRGRDDTRRLSPAEYRPEDFPGCESFHLPASELDRYEGRLEFWDGNTETAWKVSEPTSFQHEQPTRQLAQMAGRFAMVRGSRIASFGSGDLVRLNAAGRKRWLMQADEMLYLHPDRVRLLGSAIDVDADALPDAPSGFRFHRPDRFQHGQHVAASDRVNRHVGQCRVCVVLEALQPAR